MHILRCLRQHNRATRYSLLVPETLKLHLGDLRCRQIFLGCSNDSRYACILNDLVVNERNYQRICLLEGIPFQKQISLLPFPTFQLLTLFRNTGVDGHGQIDQAHEPPSMTTLRSGIGSGVLTPSSTPKSLSRPLSRQDIANLPSRSRVTSPVPGPQAATTWAMISQKVADQPLTMTSQLNKPVSVPGIRRNKKGQRIDPTPPDYKKDEVDRLRKMKLCNAHYLRDDCPYADNKCTHEHEYKISKDELQSLKLVARMSPCIHGTGCNDPKCIYGHSCPFPQATLGSMRGKGCIMAEDCRFAPEMHGVDKKAVIMTKVV